MEVMSHRRNARHCLLIIAFTLSLLGMPSLSDAGDPAFDCRKASGEIEKLICNNDALSQLDRDLATTYDAAIKMAASLDSGASTAVKELRAEQRGWIKGRNECWKDISDKLDCTKQSYQRRIAFLQARWRLVEPIKTVFYRCTNDTDTFIVSFMPTTPRDSLAIERGDTIGIFVRTRATSGAKYDGSFGKSFWSHGDEAMITWDQNIPALECQVQE